MSIRRGIIRTRIKLKVLAFGLVLASSLIAIAFMRVVYLNDRVELHNVPGYDYYGIRREIASDWTDFDLSELKRSVVKELFENNEGVPLISELYISSELQTIGKGMESKATSTTENMRIYNYKDIIISQCLKHKIDPYIVLALISVESDGNPKDTEGGNWGLMQLDKEGYYNNDKSRVGIDLVHDIEKGIIHYFDLKRYTAGGTKYVDEDMNEYVAFYAYNSGNGTVSSVFNNALKKPEKETGIEELGQAIRAKVVEDNKSRKPGEKWDEDEKLEYATKVIYVYNYLKEIDALEY